MPTAAVCAACSRAGTDSADRLFVGIGEGFADIACATLPFDDHAVWRAPVIASLRGQLSHLGDGQVIVDVAGVGYLVQIPLQTQRVLPEVGSEVSLRIHTHVREDAFQLFGFATNLELVLFEKLLQVSGIGPRLAIAALSGLEPWQLLHAIVHGEVSRLSSISGIGKKTAERIVLELRDKLALLPAPAPAPKSPRDDAEADDVLSALQNLGYRRKEAELALERARSLSAPGLESLLKAALAQLARKNP